jgi:MoxR-like ATPase
LIFQFKFPTTLPPLTTSDLTEEQVKTLLAKLSTLKTEIQKVIVGQDAPLDQLLMAFMSGGHALLEGVPGLAKTLMIRSLSDAVALHFRRIQFTPDLMPSDIIGTEILEEDHASGKRFFKFNKGPIFGNIILADEINRTPPKTQAALLEAMQEFEVTNGGNTYKLEKPFFVLATQNPIEQAGTYPLPEAQLDRFLLYIKVDYPAEAEELAVLKRTTGTEKQSISPVLHAEDILLVQSLVRRVAVHDDLVAYVNRLVRASRPVQSDVAFVKEWVEWGAGPRAGQALMLTAKARALFHGRFAVTMDDIRTMIYPVLRHRVRVSFKAEAENISSDAVTKALLSQIAEPKSPLV